MLKKYGNDFKTTKFYFIAMGFIIYLVASSIISIILLGLNNSSTSKVNPQKHLQNWINVSFCACARTCIYLSGTDILCYPVLV